LLFATAAFTTPDPVEIAHSINDGDLPDPKFTPGDIRPVTKEELCDPNTRTADVRNTPDSLKERVRRLYGMLTKRDLWCNTERGCEIDHLISLQLGGSNDLKNLWPQPYDESREWNACEKDALENRLHKLVCTDKIPLAEAQHEIATDWIASYKKHFPTKSKCSR
jgi:hypothetical protein